MRMNEFYACICGMLMAGVCIMSGIQAAQAQQPAANPDIPACSGKFCPSHEQAQMLQIKTLKAEVAYQQQQAASAVHDETVNELNAAAEAVRVANNWPATVKFNPTISQYYDSAPAPAAPAAAPAAPAKPVVSAAPSKPAHK